ncbi:unnamed protein product, partial [Amoebophrya sp. A25]
DQLCVKHGPLYRVRDLEGNFILDVPALASGPSVGEAVRMHVARLEQYLSWEQQMKEAQRMAKKQRRKAAKAGFMNGQQLSLEDGQAGNEDPDDMLTPSTVSGSDPEQFPDRTSDEENEREDVDPESLARQRAEKL